MIVVRCFGPLAIEGPALTLGPRDLGGIKPKQLFEILVSERGRAVTKDRIAELMWGDEPPRNVAATLETYASVLRRNLRTVLRTEPGAYRVAMEELDLDLDRFDALCTRARKVLGSPDPATMRAARRDLDDALALVRGDVFEDEPYATWAVRLREHYRGRFVRAAVEAADAALADGDPAEALGLAERALAVDRACERGHRAAILAHHALGKGDEALAAFQRCRAALAEELGVEPLDDTIEIAEAIRRGEREIGARRSRVAVRAPTTANDLPLLGRTAELAVLERAARDALAGTASLITVEGEAGVGKTRVIDELLRRLGTVRVGRAKGRELERELAFAPLAHALRALGDDAMADARRFPALAEILPELGSSSLGRAQAFEALVAFLAARAPVVLVFDDLQWVDASSLSAIAYLLRRSSHTPLVVIGGFRSEDVAADHPVRQFEAAVHVELAPLTAQELGDPELHARTGGNALLVVEYRRALAEGQHMPARMRDVVLARSRAAGADAHRVLVVASVLGRSFDPETLARLVDVDVAEVAELLEALCARRLLVATAERFDFRHDLIREALYESLSPPRRRVLHARAATLLEGGEPGELVHHAELAGAYELALRSAIRAGDDARARWANYEAIAHYERAERIAERDPMLLDAPARERLQLRLARALTTVGRATASDDLIGRALASAEARTDNIAVFEALEALAVAHHHGVSHPTGALAIGRRALEVAATTGDPALESRAHVLIGGPAGSLGQIDEAIAHCELAIQKAERAAIPPSPVALGRLALAVHHRGDDVAALGWADRAEAAATDQRAEESLLMARWVRSLALLGVGRYREAWRALDSIAQIGRGEEAFWHARVPNTYGAILSELCLYERALERDLESLEWVKKVAARPVREAEVHTLLNLASDRLALGQLADARANLDAVRAQIADVEYARFRWVSRLHAVEAELALAEDDPQRALGAADSCIVLARKHGQPRYDVRGKIVHARALAALGKRVPALRGLRAAARQADVLGYLGLAWRAWSAAHQISDASADRRLAEQGVARVSAALEEPLRAAFERAVPLSQ